MAFTRHIDPEVRFWCKVNIPHGGFGCWEWTGSTNGKGYGQLRLTKTRLVQTTHFIMELIYGPIDTDKVVMHLCDNRLCCNPAHLKIGSQQENILDCLSKGRANKRRGEQHQFAVLTESQVRQIYALSSSGVSQRKIAAMFGINPATVCRIRTGKKWKHIYSGVVHGHVPDLFAGAT